MLPKYEGDSGGGLSIKVGSTFYFRGIVSSGLRDQLSCDVKKFAIFTDVLKFKPWIDQIMGEDGEILTRKVVQAHLRCRIRSVSSNYIRGIKLKVLKFCYIIDQKIEREGISVAGDPNLSVQAFDMRQNKKVKFLPGNIVESFPRLTTYQVYNCSIRTINGNHFKGLNKLECLGLDLNKIASIGIDSFKDATKLRHLGLGYNNFTMIDPNFFECLAILWSSEIRNNEIEFLDEKMFVEITNVEQIGPDNNKLSKIPANLFKNNLKLEHVWLNANKIRTISSTIFDHLTNLTYFGLQNNIYK